MKVFVPFILVLVVLTAGCTPPSPNTDVMIAAARELDARFIAAFNAGDVDALMACYHDVPELTSFDMNTLVAKGHAAVREGLAHAVAGMAGGTITIRDLHYQPAGEYVVTWGIWDFTAPMPDGTSMTMTGRFTDMKTEMNGKWGYIHDHASVPMPPPSAE